MQSAARSYFQTQIATTTQGDLLIMLFDAALKFLRQAKERIAEKNYAQKGILISKALDILSELQGTLNAQKGGDLADRLQKLYFFCSTRLLAANLKMDATKIDEVMHILSGLRDAFSEANGQVVTKSVPTAAAQGTGTGHTAATPAASGLSRAAGLAAYPARPGQGLAAAKPAGAASPAPGDQPARPAAPATPRQPVVASAAPAPAAENATLDVNIPTSAALDLDKSAKPTPVRRIMAAYAASRAQS